jgi:hypothetical protein
MTAKPHAKKLRQATESEVDNISDCLSRINQTTLTRTLSLRARDFRTKIIAYPAESMDDSAG